MKQSESLNSLKAALAPHQVIFQHIITIANGVLRVWTGGTDAPGLAMTRSFGDCFGRQAGVISIPEVKYFPLTVLHRYFVLGSDGIWDI